MNLLAVTYALPPHLYPQAIQIGRLLYHLAKTVRIGAVCGQPRQLATGLDGYPDFDAGLEFRLDVPYQPWLSGTEHRLACYGLPFYGRAPDDIRGWIAPAEAAVARQLAPSGFAPDVLVTFGEPMSDHLLGLRLQRRYGLPWVAHFSDPWVDSTFRRWFPLANLVNRRLEKQVVEGADMVIFTSEETRDLVMRKYPSDWKKKTRVLPHGFEPGLYPELNPQRRGPLIVRHVGNFHAHRTPRPLFEALAALNRTSPDAVADLQVELIGEVPARMLRTAIHRQLPDGLVRKVGGVPYLRSLQLMREADLLLVIDAPDAASVLFLSKLVDYIGAGVPVLGIAPPGTSAKLIRRLGGHVADPNSPAEVAATLRQAIAASRQWRSAGCPTPWGNDAVRSEFHADRVARQMLAFLGEVRGEAVAGKRLP